MIEGSTQCDQCPVSKASTLRCVHLFSFSTEERWGSAEANGDLALSIKKHELNPPSQLMKAPAVFLFLFFFSVKELQTLLVALPDCALKAVVGDELIPGYIELL